MTFRETPLTQEIGTQSRTTKNIHNAKRTTQNCKHLNQQPKTDDDVKPMPQSPWKCSRPDARRMGLTALMSGFPNRIRWRSCLNRLARAVSDLNPSLRLLKSSLALGKEPQALRALAWKGLMSFDRRRRARMPMQGG